MKNFTLTRIFSLAILASFIGCTQPPESRRDTIEPWQNAKSDDYWKRVDTKNIWAPRVWHTTVVHDGYMWVLGGRKPDGLARDIWKSRDGLSWTRTTNNAPWMGLYSAAAVSFHDRLWVLGEEYFWGTKGHVWSSDNGRFWVKSPKPPWSGRWRHTATVYDDKIWIIGGEHDNYLNNDVWYSRGGSLWTEAKSGDGPAGKGLTQLGARSQHATVAYDGKLWLVGGTNGAGKKMADVWWTTDGSHWTRVIDDGPFMGLIGHKLVNFKDHLWLVGGSSINFGSPGGTGRKVWVTQDGANWAAYGNDPPWGPRRGSGVVILNDKIWVLGGDVIFNDGYSNDVWSTDGEGIEPIPTNERRIRPVEKIASVVASSQLPKWKGTLGVDWVEVKGQGEVPRRTGWQPFVYNNRLWLRDWSGCWSTSDGSRWDHIVTNYADGDPEKYRPLNGNITVHDNKLWITSLLVGKAWNSKDGRQWEPVSVQADMDVSGGWEFSFREKLWHVGGHRRDRHRSKPVPVNQVWSSEDGKNWEIVTRQAPWKHIELSSLFLFHEKMWIVRDSLEGRLLDDGAVWVSENGEDWEDISKDPKKFTRPFEDAQLFSAGDLLWAIDNVSGSTHTIWSSKDGIAWQKRTENITLPPNTYYFGIEYNGLWLVPRTGYNHEKEVGSIVYSPDMQKWFQFSFSKSVPVRNSSSSSIYAAHDERLWFFSANPRDGGVYTYSPTSQVHSSTNGTDWVLETDSPEWGERAEMAIVSHDGRLWMLGGTDRARSDGNPGRTYNDVWSTANGKDWELVTEEAPWTPRVDSYAVSLKGKIILLCGRRSPQDVKDPRKRMLYDAWGSTDGIEWELLNSKVPFALTGDINPPVVYDDKIWVIGAYGKSRSLIWNSEDGATWNAVVTDDSWLPRQSARVVAHDGRLWAIGGYHSGPGSDVMNLGMVNRVEWTTDGVSWKTVSTREQDYRFIWASVFSVGGRMWRIDSRTGTISFSGPGR